MAPTIQNSFYSEDDRQRLTKRSVPSILVNKYVVIWSFWQIDILICNFVIIVIFLVTRLFRTPTLHSVHIFNMVNTIGYNPSPSHIRSSLFPDETYISSTVESLSCTYNLESQPCVIFFIARRKTTASL